MSSLSQRLARLRSSGMAPKYTHDAPDSDTEEKQRPSREESIFRGKGTAISADTPPPGENWIKVDDFAWERRMEYSSILPHRYNDPFVLPSAVETSELLFYDLETTGLSGGAGNIAFLIGLGRQSGETFTVTQLFLSDYPGETALLERYAALSGSDCLQVSYNGRSFDSQVLKTRFLLNRIPPLLPPQADLLYPSRRLWKNVLPDLTLRTLETDVLDFHRTDDLPGSEAPDAWFEWLDGKPDRIDGVFRHNADDIISLARLLARLEAWGAADAAGKGIIPSGTGPSCWGMAAQWARKDELREQSWLEAGWERGERRCGLELAVRYRRRGMLEDARNIWESLNLGGRDYTAAVELAKFWEHREKNPLRALEVLVSLDSLPLKPVHRRELEHRRMRLKRKMAMESPDGGAIL